MSGEREDSSPPSLSARERNESCAAPLTRYAARKRLKRQFETHSKIPNSGEWNFRPSVQLLHAVHSTAVPKEASKRSHDPPVSTGKSVIDDNEIHENASLEDEHLVLDNCGKRSRIDMQEQHGIDDATMEVEEPERNNIDTGDASEQERHISNTDYSISSRASETDNNGDEYVTVSSVNLNCIGEQVLNTNTGEMSTDDERLVHNLYNSSSDEDNYHYVVHSQSHGDSGNNDDDDDDDHDHDHVNDEGKVFSLDETDKRLSRPVQLKTFVTNLHMILFTLAFAIRSKLTYIMIITLFKNLKKMMVESIFPTYTAGLWRLLSRKDDNANTRYWYCRTCQSGMGNGNKPVKDCKCGKCGPGKVNDRMSYFLILNIKAQLLQLLSKKTIITDLNYRFSRKKMSPDAMEDIFDGKVYKKLSSPNGFLSCKYNFSFGLFTDGAQVSVSSKASAWPVMLTINELSPQSRKKHMILAASWVDTFHPDLNLLLSPIMEQLTELYETGITWKNPHNDEKITSKFITLVITVDSGARWTLLNMTQYNGEFGCTFCYAKGMTVSGKRVYPITDVLDSCRTNEQIRRDMERVVMLKKTYPDAKLHGVKGISAVAILDYFDMGQWIIVDSMHNVYLGVAKKHMEIIMKNASEPWYIGTPNNVNEINRRIMDIKTPTVISRLPSTLDTMAMWKASEWRNWLLYYALPCLDGIVSNEHLKILRLLSSAAFILNGDSITTGNMSRARQLLGRFVKKYQTFFGIEYMSYNVHLLNHLADSVENFAAFWTHSAFPYESWNKRLIDNVTSANSRALQIATRFLITRFVEDSMIDDRVPLETRKMIHETLNAGFKRNKYATDFTESQRPFLAVEIIKKRLLNEYESEAIDTTSDGPPPLEATFYKSAVINGIDYHTKSNKQTRYSNEFIYFELEKMYAQIINVIGFTKKNDENVEENVFGLLVERLVSEEIYPYNSEHIGSVVRRNMSLIFISCDQNIPVCKPAFVVKRIDDHTVYMSRIPNLYETD